jgi:hypothetical protein
MHKNYVKFMQKYGGGPQENPNELSVVDQLTKYPADYTLSFP